MLHRKLPLHHLPQSDGSHIVWWHDKEIVVDEEDFVWFLKRYHTARPTLVRHLDGSIVREYIPIFYPKKKGGYKRKQHRPVASVIMKCPYWNHVVHLDGDQWNCRKKNLRVVKFTGNVDWTKIVEKLK